MMPKAHIVILNWNQRDMTVDCLESLKKLDYSNAEIVLVDNGSTDDSVNVKINKEVLISIDCFKENFFHSFLAIENQYQEYFTPLYKYLKAFYPGL